MAIVQSWAGTYYGRITKVFRHSVTMETPELSDATFEKVYLYPLDEPVTLYSMKELEKKYRKLHKYPNTREEPFPKPTGGWT